MTYEDWPLMTMNEAQFARAFAACTKLSDAVNAMDGRFKKHTCLWHAECDGKCNTYGEYDDTW